jgi:hypothetical protein
MAASPAPDVCVTHADQLVLRAVVSADVRVSGGRSAVSSDEHLGKRREVAGMGET